MQTTIYLASKSPRRRELLHQIGVPFELLLLRETPVNRASSEQRSSASLANNCDVDESPLANELPRDYVERVVKLKATVAHNVMLARKLVVRPILSADKDRRIQVAITPSDEGSAAFQINSRDSATATCFPRPFAAVANLAAPCSLWPIQVVECWS